MLVIGLISCVFILGFLCWLLFTLAVYALALFAGVTAGLAAYHSGSGAIGAIIIGVFAGGATLIVGQAAFAKARTPLIRVTIALLYSGPAAIAGYSATLGVAHLGVASEGWREVFAVPGALLVGGAAFARLSAFVPSRVGRRTQDPARLLPLAEAISER
jgi:hypothetical protein